MTHTDDQSAGSLYRGVRIEKRCTGVEAREGQYVRLYCWVAQTDNWVVMTSSLAAIRAAIDAHLDGHSDQPPQSPDVAA
jgi:hypothetical protein